MSVANELTSEVAMAMLKSDDRGERENLFGILLALHSTLRTLSAEERHRRRAKFLPETPSVGRAASPLSH